MLSINQGGVSARDMRPRGLPSTGCLSLSLSASLSLHGRIRKSTRVGNSIRWTTAIPVTGYVRRSEQVVQGMAKEFQQHFKLHFSSAEIFLGRFLRGSVARPFILGRVVASLGQGAGAGEEKGRKWEGPCHAMPCHATDTSAALHGSRPRLASSPVPHRPQGAGGVLPYLLKLYS